MLISRALLFQEPALDLKEPNRDGELRVWEDSFIRRVLNWRKAKLEAL